jgi:acetyl esterase/lipase
MYLGNILAQQVPSYAAPARADDYAHIPPTYTCVGDQDPFRDETLDYVAALAKAGVPTEFHLYPGCFHGFDGYAPMTGIGQQVVSQIEQSPCQNFSSSMPENHLTESQSAFKEQITTQFINIFQKLLQDVPSSPEFFRQTSSLMFNKLSECALKKPRY